MTMSAIEPIIGDFERRDIHEHISRLLRDLGNPEPPLRLEQVRALQKLDLTYYSKANLSLLDEIAHRARIAGNEITSTAKRMVDVVQQYGLRGILMLKEGDKRIFIDDDVAELKRRFLIAHEITHDLLPWHRSLLLGDNESTLNPTFHQAMEAEANYGGRRLLFLGGRFRPEALDCSFEWKSIEQLRKRYGNTLTTTLWQMVCERDPDFPAFGVVSRHPYHRDICEKAGIDNVAYFPRSKALAEHFPGITTEVAYSAICDHATSRKRGPVGEGESIFCDANGEPHIFWLHSFSNTYDLLTYCIYKKKHQRISPVGYRAA
ncbi:ImmA/IrrE family metallo-endopeptidase [Mesorhizobium sp. RIZ17]|uniref:ImmA/IrrE family metallo-endopeptidase n=1 Tax=Mesorhizobium sp. RIZ17 TaxID=3132743 RepID=UPI003DA7E610